MLLERETELAAFDRALAAARDGRGAVLGILAPCGGGRTALLEAFALRCDEAEDLVVRAGASFEERTEDGALLAALLDDLANQRYLAGQWDRTEPGNLAAALLEGESAPRPRGALVLLLDDVQWADESSLAALSGFVDRIQGADGTPVLVVFSSTDLDPVLAGQSWRELYARVPAVCTLADLSAAAVAELGDPGSRAVTGRPLLLAADAHTRAAEEVTDTGRLWLAERYRAPLAGLPASLLDVLTAVVVLDGVADTAAVAELTGSGPAAASVALTALARCGLVDGIERPRPVHAAIADALEGLRGPAALARWHGLAAAFAYRAGVRDRWIARALIAAGDQSASWAGEVFRRAARETAEEDGLQAGARCLRAALMAVAFDNPERRALLADLVEFEREFDVPTSLMHAAQTLDLAAGGREHAVLLARLSPGALDGAPVSFGPVLDRTERELCAGGEDSELLARVRARQWYGELDSPARLAEVTSRFAEDPAPLLESAGGREQLAVMTLAGMLTLRFGAEEAAGQALAVLERERPSAEHTHTALPLLVATLAAAERLEELDFWLAAVEEDTRARGRVVARCLLAGERAIVAVARGDQEQARRYLRTVLAEIEESGAGAVLSPFLIPAVTMLGDEELTSAVLTTIRRGDSTSYHVAGAAFAAGMTATRQGEHRRAVDQFRIAGDLVEQSGWVNPTVLPWRMGLAEALLGVGDVDAASEVLADEHLRAQEWGAPGLLGRVLRIRGMLLGGSTGRVLLRDAVSLLEGSCNAREAARASVALGIDLRDTADPAATEHLERGLLLARGCADRATITVAKSALDGHRMHRLEALRCFDSMAGAVPARGRGAQAGSTLTRTERVVAERVAAGLSNPEIAKELAVGVRAVEKHLTQCYRKLGVRGRSELAETLANSSRRG
ncbi:helix-turn-helix transcriptional regulator [Sciscionella sediminilitoris]|uniref:helix-turn-helix transcriptional regulator n=1 Tax=Sciscionella sediminilitoris TaxID=1445613 RepID=UPI0004DF8FF7|nr:helix-turn-helix transcriptional regulator [Sciscionella sp. SE31]